MVKTKTMIYGFAAILVFSLVAGAVVPSLSGGNSAFVKESIISGDTISASQIMQTYFSSNNGTEDYQNFYEPFLSSLYSENIYINIMWLILPHYLNDQRPTEESLEQLKGLFTAEVCENDEDGNQTCRFSPVSAEEYLKNLKETEFYEGIKEINDEKVIQFLGTGLNVPGDEAFGSIDTVANYYSETYKSPFNPFSNAGWTGQCTWYVYARVNEVNDQRFQDLPLGDARTWYETAAAKGYSVGQAPAKNSIVVWGGDLQHVAYVESYDGETITISEGNASGTSLLKWTTLEKAIQSIRINSGDISWLINRQSNGGGYFIGFIYLDGDVNTDNE